jgi:hypothetical protein
MSTEVRSISNTKVIGEVNADSAELSLSDLEALAGCCRRRAVASKVIWMSKQFKNFEKISEIDAWGKTMNYLCDSLSMAAKVGKNCSNGGTIISKVLADEVEECPKLLADEVEECPKVTNDLEKSDSVKGTNGFLAKHQSGSESESSGGSEDEVSALSSDGNSKGKHVVNRSSSEKRLCDKVPEKPPTGNKTLYKPPAIDFNKLSLFQSAQPKAHIVQSLPSPFFAKGGNNVTRWRRNSLSAVTGMNGAKPNQVKPVKHNGYFSADEVNKQAA